MSEQSPQFNSQHEHDDPSRARETKMDEETSRIVDGPRGELVLKRRELATKREYLLHQRRSVFSELQRIDDSLDDLEEEIRVLDDKLPRW